MLIEFTNNPVRHSNKIQTGPEGGSDGAGLAGERQTLAVSLDGFRTHRKQLD